MHTREVLGLREAQAAVDAILAEASKDPGQPVSVAIVDYHGEIILAARMDGATPMFNFMALKKARSCATTGKNTRDWFEFLNKRNYSAQDFVPNATRIPGGVAVCKPGSNKAPKAMSNEEDILGGIGVSGRSGDEDEALSMEGLKALEEAAWG